MVQNRKFQKPRENYKYSISIYALCGVNMRTTIELNDAILETGVDR